MRTEYQVVRQGGKTEVMKILFKHKVMQMKPGQKAVIARSEERGGNIVITRNANQVESK